LPFAVALAVAVAVAVAFFACHPRRGPAVEVVLLVILSEAKNPLYFPLSSRKINPKILQNPHPQKAASHKPSYPPNPPHPNHKNTTPKHQISPKPPIKTTILPTR
jgi:hypothetical protein